MNESVRFLGLDVHAETIAVAVAEANGEVRSLEQIGNWQRLRACYEAGPTGCVLYWQLAGMGWNAR